jgi:predicted Zn-dependent protease
MAFGFGFNKQKVLSAAEKFVQQGKLQNAIAEYEKVLKNDAKDLTVNNTIGDLYARLGDTAKPSSASRRLAMPMRRRASRSRASPCTRRSPSCSRAWMDL